MFLSIIVPTYNCEEYIEECLNSCLNQTFKGSYEIICVDDGSTDDTVNIIEKFTTRDNVSLVKVFHGGPSFARNCGIKKLSKRGGYVWFVDADDVIIPQAVELLSKSCEEQKADSIFFSVYFFKNKFTEMERKLFYDGKLSKNGYCETYCWSKIYKTSCIIENKLFFKENIVYGEDELFFYEFKKTNPTTSYIEETLYCHRERANSLMTNVGLLPNAIKRIDSVIEAMYILKEDIDKTNSYEALRFFASKQSLLKFSIAKLPHKLYKKYLKIAKKNKLFSRKYYFVEKNGKYVKGNFFMFKNSLLKARLYYRLKNKILK